MNETPVYDNPEIDAMRRIVEALDSLEEDAARARVLRRANDRYGASQPDA